MDKKQAQMKQEIAGMLRKKDYYDILGVQKTANEAEIKKAYKKLALRFHPDKNSYEGAKDVFKKVSNAYTVLINPEQKERYDRYGPDEQQQARYRQQHYRASHHTGDDEYDDFDEIFRAFFGMNRMQMHRNAGYGATYHFNMGQRQQQAHAQGQRNQGIGVHYMFILVFLFYAISPLFKTAPYFSLNVSSDYRFKAQTQRLHVQYFVRQAFFQQAKKDPNFKRNIDLEVDEAYLLSLKKNCEQASRLEQMYRSRAYQYGPGQYRDYYLAEARKVDKSSCRKIDQFHRNHPDYVSQIYYYR